MLQHFLPFQRPVVHQAATSPNSSSWTSVHFHVINRLLKTHDSARMKNEHRWLSNGVWNFNCTYKSRMNCLTTALSSLNQTLCYCLFPSVSLELTLLLTGKWAWRIGTRLEFQRCFTLWRNLPELYLYCVWDTGCIYSYVFVLFYA